MDNMLPRVSNYVYIFCHWLANFKRDQNQAYRSNNPRKRTISRLDTSAKLSISLRLREVVQILVREVLNWQVKPWENIRSFMNTCRFKSLFTFTSYFRSLFSPFWLSTEQQLWLYYWVLTYKQLLKTSRAYSHALSSSQP